MTMRDPNPKKAVPVALPQLTPAPYGALQRKCACGGSATTGGDCPDCKKKKMAAEGKTTAGFAPLNLHEHLPSPGHDFSRVRVDGARAPAHPTGHAINSPGDAYEREADHVPGDVMHGHAQESPENASHRPRSQRDFDFSRVSVAAPPRIEAKSGSGGRRSAPAGTRPVRSAEEGSASPAMSSGQPTKTTTGDERGPEWLNWGEFHWWIRWNTDGTSGWIVQSIKNEYSGTKKDGSALTLADAKATPFYYEAWTVNKDGVIMPGNLDTWNRPILRDTDGKWNTQAVVYWTDTDPQQSGFRAGAIPDAGQFLLSSFTAPANLSAPLLNRAAYGAWHPDGTTKSPGCYVS
jgi:hypothetical protein